MKVKSQKKITFLTGAYLLFSIDARVMGAPIMGGTPRDVFLTPDIVGTGICTESGK